MYIAGTDGDMRWVVLVGTEIAATGRTQDSATVCSTFGLGANGLSERKLKWHIGSGSSSSETD